MTDETENVRRVLVQVINASLSPDEQERYRELCEKYGVEDVYTTQTVQESFEVLGFMAPFVVVRRRSDNAKGTLQFSHSPRFYFGFQVA
jgi:hypothetical protein